MGLYKGEVPVFCQMTRS